MEIAWRIATIEEAALYEVQLYMRIRSRRGVRSGTNGGPSKWSAWNWKAAAGPTDAGKTQRTEMRREGRS